MPLTKTRTPSVQAQFAKRVRSATHVRPVFMPKDEFESLLHRKLLDVAGDKTLTHANDLAVVRGLGHVGALELLMKIGLVFHELDIPGTGQDDE